MFRLRRRRRSFLAATILLFAMAPVAAASDGPDFCSHTLDLIAQAKTGFAALREDASHGAGTYEAALSLPDDVSCEILADAEKNSYRCLWSYPRGDADSRKTFQHLVAEMRNCIGERSDESLDKSVNHPDFYASHAFALTDAVVSVSLKDKSLPLRSFLSIRIDAMPEAE